MAGDVTAFLEDQVIATGERSDVALRVGREHQARQAEIRAYDDEDGRVVDLDYREPAKPARGRGRPPLGVTAREVTLLPRHWEWLAAQPGGASAALRRLVEAARKAPPGPEARRDSAYRFMADRCGDRPGFEEALRALYRDDRQGFDSVIAAWPDDVRAYIARLLG